MIRDKLKNKSKNNYEDVEKYLSDKINDMAALRAGLTEVDQYLEDFVGKIDDQHIIIDSLKNRMNRPVSHLDD